ncbi:hypothetical protein GQ457_11G030900 [Hibiscus cannabinus]
MTIFIRGPFCLGTNPKRKGPRLKITLIQSIYNIRSKTLELPPTLVKNPRVAAQPLSNKGVRFLALRERSFRDFCSQV